VVAEVRLLIEVLGLIRGVILVWLFELVLDLKLLVEVCFRTLGGGAILRSSGAKTVLIGKKCCRGERGEKYGSPT